MKILKSFAIHGFFLWSFLLPSTSHSLSFSYQLPERPLSTSDANHKVGKVINGSLNSFGMMVGSFAAEDRNGVLDGVHGFIFRDNRVLSPVDFPGAKNTWFLGVNDSNVGVGYAEIVTNGQSQFVGFSYDSDGFQTFSYNNAKYTIFSSINNKGVIAGWALSDGVVTPFTVVNDQIKPVKAEFRGIRTVDSINKNNVLAGKLFRGVPYQVGVNQPVPKAFNNVLNTDMAASIILNDRKSMAGSQSNTGFLVRNGRVISLLPRGMQAAQATGINNKDEVSIRANLGVLNGVLREFAWFYSPKLGYYLLEVPNCQIETALAINQSSVIAGSYQLDPNGDHYLYLAYPH